MLVQRVFLKNEDITDWNDSQINDFLSKNILLDKAGHTENVFRCKNIDYDEEGMVISIIFEKYTKILKKKKKKCIIRLGEI